MEYENISRIFVLQNNPTMTKFQKVLSDVGFYLMLVLPIGVLVSILCSDYRTEEEYNQYQTIVGYCVNWYTFGMFLLGVFLFSIVRIKLPKNFF